MINLSPYYEIIEACIRNLGIDPITCRTEKGGQWDLKKGSASVWLDVFPSSQNADYGYFQALAPICKIPEVNVAAFYREALETNHNLYGVGFTIYNDKLYIKVIREVEGLNFSEAMAMINRIGTYADDYDDYFQKKYFNSTGSRAPFN